MGDSTNRVIGRASELLAQRFEQQASDASEQESKYREELQGAEGEEIFKYLLLTNMAALQGYVAQTRLQAEQSFQLSLLLWIHF